MPKETFPMVTDFQPAGSFPAPLSAPLCGGVFHAVNDILPAISPNMGAYCFQPLPLPATT